jgi:hypothetical protein
MEFVVIRGGKKDDGEHLANRMRAHGYHYFSPDQFFIDDFGDVHFNVDQLPQAKQWCAHHALKDIEKHQDVVISGILVNQDLLTIAKNEGYHVKVIELDQDSRDRCDAQVNELISIHEREHPSLLNKIAHQLFGNESPK